MTQIRRRMIGGMGCLLFLAGLGTAQAATSIWINGTSGFWTNGPNWAGGTAPGGADTANFTSRLANASFAIQTNTICVDGQYVANTLQVDWAGLTYSNSGTAVYLAGSVANASLSLTNLYVAWGDSIVGGGGGSTMLNDILVFSNMSLSVGSPTVRGTLQIAQKVASTANYAINGTVAAAGTNATFTAYLTQLLIGFGGTSAGQGSGKLDLSQAQSATLDVTGTVEIASSSIAGPNYQTGSLLLNNGTAKAGNLYVAYTTAAETQTGSTPNKTGTLTLSNTTFRVATNGIVYLGGRGQNGNATYQINRAVVNITANGVAGGGWPTDFRKKQRNGWFWAC